ncbi:MAG: galactose mutarotase [Clostridiales bacterium]|nr:galactose mutarotase [Clostridiales bacterium]
MSITQKLFGNLKDGTPVYEYTMTNRSGASLSAINYGGIVTSIKVPDQNQLLQEVTLGYNVLAPYLIPNGNLGALIGRYGNRIANSRFMLDDQEILLSKSEGEHHLHGGNEGESYNTLYWDITPKEGMDEDTLTLSLLSPDGQGGFPGNLEVTVTYSWNNENQWQIEYEAKTDADTLVNLTQHTYFNLSGDEKENILNHVVEIEADTITPTDKELITTGDYLDVTDTPYDFRQPRAIADAINQPGEWDQLEYGLGGYDFNYVLTKDHTGPDVQVYSPSTGILLQVFTDQPGVQLYTGNQLDCESRSGKKYQKHDGLCLETQHYPDSPNKPHFPSVLLKKHEEYYTKTLYQFSIKEEE